MRLSLSLTATCTAVVLALCAPPPAVQAQGDLSCVTTQESTPLLANSLANIGVVVTNLGPGPDPGPRAWLIFPFPTDDYAVPTSEDDPWQYEISQGACELFLDQGGPDGGDDGIPWNDRYFFDCGLGTILPGEAVTMTATLPLQMSAPPYSVFEVHSPPAVSGRWVHNTGLFGAAVNQFDATADLELVDDGSANPSEGCNPPIGFTPGNIAMIDRGSCQFGEKAVFAEAAGAIATVIVNNDPQQDIMAFRMAPGDFGAAVTIPVIMITTGDGDILKAEMLLGPVNATIGRDYSEGDWEMPMISVVFDQLNDPNDENDTDRTPVTVTPAIFAASFEYGDARRWARTVGE